MTPFPEIFRLNFDQKEDEKSVNSRRSKIRLILFRQAGKLLFKKMIVNQNILNLKNNGERSH